MPWIYQGTRRGWSKYTLSTVSYSFTFLESLKVLLVGQWQRNRANRSLGRALFISASAQFSLETMIYVQEPGFIHATYFALPPSTSCGLIGFCQFLFLGLGLSSLLKCN